MSYAELTVEQHEAAAAFEHAERFAKAALKIVPKVRRRGLIPFVYNDAQVALHGKLMAQHRAGKPLRLIALKSRQVGVSTQVQGFLIQRATQTSHRSTLVVAHDAETGGKLFAIGHRMYANLPEELKPEIRSFRRTRFLHFGERGEARWMEGGTLPDSTFWVDTAGEFEAGRGGTYHDVHLSESAFWPQPEQKYLALMSAIPDDPDTLIVNESTANGNNFYKELWDDAVEGRSEFVPFFWPWWKQAEYTRPFMAGEREEFRPGDLERSPYAEEEPELLDPGPIDIETGEHVPLTLEQLNWRRKTIAKLGGKIETFHQEMPVSPEQSFLATGNKVFEPILVQRAMAQAERTDPRVGQGGPLLGMIEAGAHERRAGQHGPVEVPSQPKWKPARNLLPGESADWRVFGLDEKDGAPVVPVDGLYVIGVDVSEGIPESELGDAAYHAIQVIDHRTKEQVCEYRSRCDPDLLADYALLTALLFNDAWLAVEVTGPGLPVFRRLWRDYRWRFLYFRKSHDRREDRQSDRMGWSTDRSTKPVLLAGVQELLREGTHGIKSRRLASELSTYVRLSTGRTRPERGKFADLLMAYAIAQQVAQELPLRVKNPKRKLGYVPRNPVTGY